LRISKILSYILYTVILLGSLAVTSWAMSMIKFWVGRNFRPLPGYIGYSVIFIFLGLLLAVENLVKEFRKDGNWSVNIIRLIIMGVPLGFFAFYLVFAITLKIPLPSFLSYNIFPISGLFFGYTLLTSLYKKQAILTSDADKTADV